jgi:hypothetical protein
MHQDVGTAVLERVKQYTIGFARAGENSTHYLGVSIVAANAVGPPSRLFVTSK